MEITAATFDQFETIVEDIRAKRLPAELPEVDKVELRQGTTTRTPAKAFIAIYRRTQAMRKQGISDCTQAAMLGYISDLEKLAAWWDGTKQKQL